MVAAGDHRETQAHQVAERIAPAPRAPPARAGTGLGPGGLGPVSPGAAVDHVLRSRGTPIEPRLRHEMERHLGQDLSAARIHTGAAAGRSARDHDAAAYTVGEHIVFGAGRYAPDTAAGRHLLAHELAHVALHRTGPSPAERRGPDGGDVHGPIFRSVEDDAAEFERREQALSSLDWMASITPAVDDAPVMIAWAQRSAERFYQPDTRDRKRGYIAEGIVKVHDRLVGKAAQAKRGADGALLEVSPFGTESAWTPERPASVAEIPPFSAAEMAQWHTAAEVFAQEAAPQRRGKGRGRKPGREVQTPQGRRVETFRVINSITFTKREGMTAATDEGQAEILWLHIAATHPGLTGDQVTWIVNQIGVRRAADEYRLTPQWKAEFEKAEPGTRITVTNSDAFDLDVVRATARLPSQHDLMVEGFRQGVVDAAGGMILAYGVFGIGVIALTGGMAVGGLAALGGEVTVSGIAAGGAVASEGAGFWTMAGVGARYGGQYLVLNGPALWNTVSSYGGALLTGAAIGDRLYNEGLYLSNLPDYLTDLGPLVEGAFPKLPELPRLSGFAEPDEGGTSLAPRRGIGLRGGGGPGSPGGPGGDGEPDLLIIPPRLDKATGKIRSSVTDLRGGATYDAEVDPITRNGTIVRRDSGEVVGNIWNGVPSPVGTDPPAGGGGTGAGTVGRAPALPAPAVPAPAMPAPALPASRDAQPAGAPPQPRPRARGWADFLPFLDVARRSQQASQEKYGLRPEHLAMDPNATKPPASARRFGGDDPDFEADIDRALGPYGTPVRDQPTGGGPPVGQRPVLGPSRGMRSEGPPISIKDAQHPDRGGDGADRITRPHQVLEVGAGPVETDLGVPKDPALVQVTQTDLTPPAPTTPALDPPRVVRQFDATGPLPDDLVGRFETVLINNARYYRPNLPQLARALVPGGRIIFQGRAKTVGNQKDGFNPDFQQLYDEALTAVKAANPTWKPKDGTLPPNPGVIGNLAVTIDLVPSSKGDSSQIMGSDWHRTSGVRSGGGPNARLIYWLLGL